MSFVETRPVIFILSGVSAYFEVATSAILLILLIDRNVQDVDFVVNGVIDILLLLLQYKLFEVLSLSSLQLPQSALHRVILFADLVYHLQQLLNLKGFIHIDLLRCMAMQLFLQSVDLIFFLNNYPIFHLS